MNIDKKILVFIIMGIIEFIIAEKKNSDLEDKKEKARNNLTLYSILLINITQYLVAIALNTEDDTELMIQLILFIVPFVLINI